jgi:hypothetical protein
MEANCAAGGGGAAVVPGETTWMAGKSYNDIKDKSLDRITIPFSNPKNKGLLKNSREIRIAKPIN